MSKCRKRDVKAAGKLVKKQNSIVGSMKSSKSRKRAPGGRSDRPAGHKKTNRTRKSQC